MKMNEWYFPLKHLNHLLIIIFDLTIDISTCSSYLFQRNQVVKYVSLLYQEKTSILTRNS